MTIIDDRETLHIFLEDSREHLNGIKNDLLTIEAAGAEMDVALVNKAFRAVHSMKGTAGFLGLDAIKDLAHGMENMLNMVRNGELEPTASVISTLVAAADVLAGLVHNPTASPPVKLSSHVEALKNATTALLPIQSQHTVEAMVQIPGAEGLVFFMVSEFALDQARKGGKAVYLIELNLRDLEASGTMPLDILKELQELGTLIDSMIDVAAVGPLTMEGLPPSIPFCVLLATLLDVDMLSATLQLDASQICRLTEAELCTAPPGVVEAGSALAATPVAEGAAATGASTTGPDEIGAHLLHVVQPARSQCSVGIPMSRGAL